METRTAASSSEGASGAKTYFGGTYRVVDPAVTWRRVWRLRSSFGITRLARLTGLDYVGIPGFAAIRPNAKSLSVSQGKGITDDAARASALMEAVELWHAEQAVNPVRTASAVELRRTSNVIDVDRLPRRPGVDPLSPDATTAWVEGTNLFDGTSMWVPRDTVVVDSTRCGSPTFPHSTNGLASGNTADEALVHALCELIERDAYALWQFNPADPDGVQTILDLATVTDPDCRTLLEQFDAADLTVVVNDITSDLAVPSYTCLVGDRPGNFRAIGLEWGAGSHLEPAVALSRALTEAAQSRLTAISGSRDDIADSRYVDVTDEDLVDFGRRVAAARPGIRWDQRPSLSTEHLATDVTTLVDRLALAGVDAVVAVDLTRPEHGISVVKVVATDLEGPYGQVHVNRRGLEMGHR